MLHARKKLELVIEENQLEDAIAWLKSVGVKGYTVLPVLGGEGRHGARGIDPITGVGGNVYLFAVMSEATAQGLMEAFTQRFPHLAGIALLSDLAVIRPEHF